MDSGKRDWKRYRHLPCMVVETLCGCMVVETLCVIISGCTECEFGGSLEEVCCSSCVWALLSPKDY